ncbi:MAG: HAMP domain-containing sensor histidine kinase [Coriobacteriia bacterium]|nr:HAMP domain-containing sensor histidine kinase [Coriobacteriia bacterium]
MRRPGFAAQLGLAFAAVAAFTALLATVGVAISWQRSFEGYVRERVQADANVLAEVAGTSYTNNAGWGGRALIELAMLGERNGLRVQVLDSQGAILVDSARLPVSSFMPGVPSTIVGTATQDPGAMREPVVRAPVYANDAQVGSVRVASKSPGSFLTDSDQRFRSASSSGLAVAAGLAVVFATAGGLLYSRLFTQPIERVTRTAAALRAGRLDARTGLQREDEVGLLGRTLDEMADSIQAEREFERRLTADVAHELRTPLQAIQATVEAMQDGVLPADGEHLGIVRNETVRLGRLADSILELSRLENRSVAFRMAEIDPATPLQRAVETHRALIESIGLELVTDIAEGSCAMADSDRLTQAFGNLLSNAARYTPEGGRITVRLDIDQKTALVSVTDTGIGVAPENRDRVFTRFWRSDEARERSRGGFGIGLAVVREIIEQHGGSVGFRSNEPGLGTTFEVRLPVQRKRQRV